MRSCFDGSEGGQGAAPYPGLALTRRRDHRTREEQVPRRRPPPGSWRFADDEPGEAANRLSRLGVPAPEGVDGALAVANRNYIIHQYDAIDRELTWLTLSRDLPAWRSSLDSLFARAATTITDDSD
jgi:hypothetical protein